MTISIAHRIYWYVGVRRLLCLYEVATRYTDDSALQSNSPTLSRKKAKNETLSRTQKTCRACCSFLLTRYHALGIRVQWFWLYWEQLVYCTQTRARSLESPEEGHNWFLNQFKGAQARDFLEIYNYLPIYFGKSRFKPLAIWDQKFKTTVSEQRRENELWYIS
jgi:hypothetical protein